MDNNFDNLKLSLKQIEVMEHTLGIEIWNKTWKKKKQYVAFRNYYISGIYEFYLDELVGFGLMAVETIISFDNEMIIYNITQNGIDYLSRLLGIKIIYNFNE
jgi:hypothetical protein